MYLHYPMTRYWQNCYNTGFSTTNIVDDECCFTEKGLDIIHAVFYSNDVIY